MSRWLSVKSVELEECNSERADLAFLSELILLPALSCTETSLTVAMASRGPSPKASLQNCFHQPHAHNKKQTYTNQLLAMFSTGKHLTDLI
jgi:hypothetical protein